MSNHNKFHCLKRSNTNKRMLVFITCIDWARYVEYYHTIDINLTGLVDLDFHCH